MNSPLIAIHNLTPDTPIAQLWEAVQLCLKLGRINQSTLLAYQATQQDPSQQQRYREHYLAAVKVGAELAEEIGDYPRAAYYWEKLIQQTPNNALVWHGLGIARVNCQDYPAAQMALERCVQLQPSNQKARSQLAEIQAMLQGK